jgi:Ca2+-binding RTX toxin-like protein
MEGSLANNILGTPDADELTGTADADIISGLAGDDTITGDAADDIRGCSTRTMDFQHFSSSPHCRGDG